MTLWKLSFPFHLTFAKSKKRCHFVVRRIGAMKQ
ncbi:hypothetical protein X975_13023, partial [Stegodyphus mimosarum]